MEQALIDVIQKTAQNNPASFLIIILIFGTMLKGIPITAYRKYVKKENGSATLHGNLDIIRNQQAETLKKLDVIESNCLTHWKVTAKNEARVEDLQRQSEAKGK